MLAVPVGIVRGVCVAGDEFGVSVLSTNRRRSDQELNRYPSGYVPGYDGNAARKLERVEEEPIRKSRERKRRRVRKQLDLAVREPGKIAPFAVVGIFAVCLMAVVLLNQYANLMVVSDAAGDLRGQLSSLQEKEMKLLTQYERAYDLSAIEQEFLASGQMMKPQGSQIETISLAEPDAVEYYENQGFGSSILAGIRDIFSAIGALF